MKIKTLEEKLEQIPFGALVEVTLKNKRCGANYKTDEIEIISRATNKNDEFGIKHVVGYNGRIKNKQLDLSGCSAIAYCNEEEVDDEKNKYLCLNPTIHYEDASREMHFQGEGYVKIPLIEIKSFVVLNTKRVGLRVVN